MSVADKFCLRTVASLRIMMLAFVLYKKSSYLGFAKKVSSPSCAISILPKPFTLASPLPTTLPLMRAAICAAVKFIVCKFC